MTVALWAVAARAMPPRVDPTPARAAQPSRLPAGKGTWALPAGSRACRPITGAPARPLLAQPVSSNLLRRTIAAVITEGWLACGPPRLARDFLVG
jgi:hypothetical protein